VEERSPKTVYQEGEVMTEAFPLQWPLDKTRTGFPQRSRFVTSFAVARNELLKEIKMLGGVHPVLSTNLPLRRDGLPYANQPEPKDRGVAVYFTLKGQSMCFACDRWDRVVDNVQAIRHTISALRGIERWGTGDMVQQAFTGFIALPNPESPHSILGVPRTATRDEIEAAFREKAKKAHPDCGGSNAEMRRLNEARQEALV
jgi:hypothetical protein